MFDKRHYILHVSEIKSIVPERIKGPIVIVLLKVVYSTTNHLSLKQCSNKDMAKLLLVCVSETEQLIRNPF